MDSPTPRSTSMRLYQRSMTARHAHAFLPLFLLVIWLVLGLADTPWVVAANQPAPQPNVHPQPLLRVGSATDIPGLFDHHGDTYSGFYVDLWEAIATELGVQYEWVVSDTLPDLVEAIVQGNIDVAAMHLSITAEREQVMDFTHNVFHEGYQLYVSNMGGAGKFNFFLLLYHAGIFTFMGEALLVLLAFAHLVWLVEKRKPDSDFHQGYLHGIEDALWWSLVTITTVGYGDKAPKTRLGRLIAVGWMLMSLFVVSMMIGRITTMMTVANLQSSIRTVDDLSGKSVGVVAGTVFDQYMTHIDIEPVRYRHSTELFEALAYGQLDAVLSDTVHGLLLPRRFANRIKKAGSTFKRDNIALGLQSDSDYEEPINRALATLYDNGHYDRIYRRWFGDER